MSADLEALDRAAGGAAAPGSDLEAEAPLEWSFNPWRERPGLSALAAVAALAMCVAVLRLEQAPLVTAALCMAAVAALAPLLGPSRCRIDARGVARRGPFGWDRRPWGEVRRARLRRGGVLISPFLRPHWLDPYRSVFLPIPSRARAMLLPEIAPRLARHGF